MTRADDLYGKNDPDAIFDGHPMRPVPLPQASRRKSVQDYDKSIVHGLLRTPPGDDLTKVDPRTLHATQPSITRAGVRHYMDDDSWQQTGETFADKGNAGNRYPVVYDREDGQRLLLSGHHRAMAALLKGQQLIARRVEGPWGPPRGQ